jgi:hypothetical protein
MFDTVATSYPAYFQSNLSRLKGSMSKSLLKVSADRVSAEPQTLTNIRLPIGSLLNLQSLALWFDVTTSGTVVTFPTRYSSSFIKRMSLTMNNQTIQVINDYNLIYNVYADHTNKDYTKALGGEFLDNSIRWVEGGAAGALDSTITGSSTLLNSATHQTYKMCINNWVGMFGSASTGILSTDKIGEIVVSIEWAPVADVLGGTAETTLITDFSSCVYNINNIYMSCEALSFSDDSYYQAINSAEDLKIGFNDYVVTKFASTTKTTGINVTTYVSAGSIDHILGTALVSTKQSVRQMMAFGGYGAGASEATVANSFTYLANPIAFTGNTSANTIGQSGDGFFSTQALQRNLQLIESSQFSINNKLLNYGALSPQEVFQNNLCALGYEGIDSSHNGFNKNILSLAHYNKYYAACIQSLELIDKDSFFISGLSSAGSSAAINWVVKFTGASTQELTPVLIFKLSRVLHVGKGRSLFVE